MRRFLILAVAALALVGGIALLVAARGTAAPYCGIRWGSLPKQDSHYASASITNLRAGRHPCFDRLVIDLGRGGPACRDRTQPATRCAT